MILRRYDVPLNVSVIVPKVRFPTIGVGKSSPKGHRSCDSATVARLR